MLRLTLSWKFIQQILVQIGQVVSKLTVNDFLWLETNGYCGDVCITKELTKQLFDVQFSL